MTLHGSLALSFRQYVRIGCPGIGKPGRNQDDYGLMI